MHQTTLRGLGFDARVESQRANYAKAGIKWDPRKVREAIQEKRRRRKR